MSIGPRKREAKRAAILRAAQETFFTEGYLGSSMDQIARRAGVTKQTVYRYFPSKELLFQATLAAQRADADCRFQQELDREDPVEALTRFAVGFLEMHLSEEHLAGVRLMVAEGPSAPEMTRAFFTLGPERTKARLVEFLTTRFRVPDPEYAVRMFLGTLLGLRMNVLVGLLPTPTHAELVRHAERSVAVCLRGLAGSGPESRAEA